tara:strand:+ start:1356 stop:1823 length:468 start_codon:yes stop_codon:yes gene_type:complete
MIIKAPTLTPEEEKLIQEEMRFRNIGREEAEKRIRRRANKMARGRKATGRFVKSEWQEILKRKKHPALKRAGVGGFSKPKRTPKHPKKSHVVVVKDGKKIKTIRFGEQGASVAGKPKKGESKRMKAKRKSFKSRHKKNINRGKTSAAYWANRVKW